MKAQIISPPCVSSYVNLDYHFVELGETIAYLRRDPRWDVALLDGIVPGTSWSEVVELLLEEPDVLMVHVTLENTAEAGRLVRLARDMLPSVRTACYGRGAFHIAHLFRELEVDWIVLEQDWEVALAGILSSVAGEASPLVPGTLTRTGDAYRHGGKGRSLQGHWELPALTALPLTGYRTIPGDESRLQADKPDVEMAIGISRGCDAYCGYCPIPDVMGRTETFRQNLPETAAYLEHAAQELGFTSVSLFGANFTRHRSFVEAFCATVSSARTSITWKCVTSPAYLDERLVAQMAQSGCTRIAIGVESIREDGRNRFAERVTADELAQVSSWCRAYDVALVCFVMAGLPAQPAGELAYTLRTVDAVGGVPRPMVYVDFRRLRSVTAFEEVYWANRKSIVHPYTRGQLTAMDLALVAHDWRQWLALHESRQGRAGI